MTPNVAELAKEFMQIHGTWEQAGIESRGLKLRQLHSMQKELGELSSTDAADLRRRVQAMIAEAEHVQRRDSEQRQSLQHRNLDW